MNYEAERAMFEAYGRNKYEATGVIQWMLNNAWPSIIWNLYDYYLVPSGAYFGSQKACEQLHVQYSYDDNSVAVVNGYGAIFHQPCSRDHLRHRRKTESIARCHDRHPRRQQCPRSNCPP